MTTLPAALAAVNETMPVAPGSIALQPWCAREMHADNLYAVEDLRLGYLALEALALRLAVALAKANEELKPYRAWQAALAEPSRLDRKRPANVFIGMPPIPMHPHTPNPQGPICGGPA
jgi:hypothetical protein